MKDYKETEEKEFDEIENPSDASSDTDFPTSETQEDSTDMAFSDNTEASNDANFNYDQNESDANDYNTDFPTSETYQEGANEGEDWKNAQAEHAMAGHENEFKKLGIDNTEELVQHSENIRENPDFTEELPRERTAYAQYSDEGTTHGTIVIDNPSADNGGTIITNRDIEKKIRKLKG